MKAGWFGWNRRHINKREVCHPGGRRFGAGRHKCGSKWAEDTVLMRIPKSQIELVRALLENSQPTEMI